MLENTLIVRDDIRVYKLDGERRTSATSATGSARAGDPGHGTNVVSVTSGVTSQRWLTADSTGAEAPDFQIIK